MLAPILDAKLYAPPPRPGMVSRPRLIERLNEGLHRRLTLLSAPAGFGKTTLAAEWALACGRPAAWLSLDEGDNDPIRFLAYLAAALRTVPGGSIGAGVLSALQSPHPPPLESLQAALLNEISSAQADFLLILDDYHAVASGAVDGVVAFLLAHRPPPVHLVIATREDPRLPLARLRARGQMTELRAADLRFTSSEAAAFLRRAMGLDLQAEDIAALEARTEGWIAGLQLAALSMQGRADTAGFIRAFTGSHRFVLDYLVEEVLARQPEPVRAFLLETAMLDRLTGPLCDAVTGRADGKEMLDALERANLFVIPLDDERRWFRYHRLFADMLLAHAQEAQPEQIPERHRRAGEWHERHGLPFEAIRHALAAGDFARAANLAEAAARAMLISRQEETLLGWLNALPDEVVRARPVLSVRFALALLAFDLEAAEARVRDAERWLDRADSERPAGAMVVVDEEGFRSLPGTIAIVRAYRAGALEDVPGSMHYARRALDLLPEDDYLWRGAAAALLGIANWTNGDLDAAYQSFSDGMAILRKSGDPTHTVGGAYILADIRAAQGRLRDAERICEQGLKTAAGHGEYLAAPAADLYVGLSELHLERGGLEAAAQFLRQSRETSEHGGIIENRHRWYVAAARVAEAEGDSERALDLLDEAERLYVRSPDPYLRPIPALRARAWLRQGRIPEALDWARERGLSPDGDLTFLREFEYVTLARVLLARFRTEGAENALGEAVRLLERLRQAAEAGGRMGSAIEILALLALAYEAQGGRAPALDALERALALAEPEGCVRVFADEGRPMAALLLEVEGRGGSPELQAYARRLRAAIEEQAGSPARAAAPGPPPLVEPLSEREMEVLRLLGTDLNGPEIARELMVSLNTLRTHSRNIYAKLGVNNRRAALRRALELGLL